MVEMNMETAEDNWVVMDPEQRNTIRCRRCDQKHVLQLPMTANKVVKTLRGFVQIHAECKRKPEPKMVGIGPRG